jgi:formate hydrogenlyase subunit 6/NADH:ubiquinone oxidoreductase subunit I
MPVAKMTSIIFKYSRKKPSTRRYPYVKRTAYTGARGKVVIDVPACIYCGICMRHCPANAIFVSLKEKIWTIDHFRCVNCKACIELCPKKCLYMETEQATPSLKRTGQEPSLKNA